MGKAFETLDGDLAKETGMPTTPRTGNELTAERQPRNHPRSSQQRPASSENRRRIRAKPASLRIWPLEQIGGNQNNGEADNADVHVGISGGSAHRQRHEHLVELLNQPAHRGPD